MRHGLVELRIPDRVEVRHLRRRCLLPDIIALHVANNAHPWRLCVYRGAILLGLIQVLAIRAASANHIVIIVALRSYACRAWFMRCLAIISYRTCSIWQFEYISRSFSRLGHLVAAACVRLFDHVLKLLSSLRQMSLVLATSLRELTGHNINTVLEALLEDFMGRTEIVRCQLRLSSGRSSTFRHLLLVRRWHMYQTIDRVFTSLCMDKIDHSIVPHDEIIDHGKVKVLAFVRLEHLVVEPVAPQPLLKLHQRLFIDIDHLRLLEVAILKLDWCRPEIKTSVLDLVEEACLGSRVIRCTIYCGAQV